QVCWCAPVIQLLGRLRQENHLNPGGGGCSELRSRHRTLAWVIQRDSVSQKKETRLEAALPRGGWDGGRWPCVTFTGSEGCWGVLGASLQNGLVLLKTTRTD
uniref:Uncharacterized protein n=1 Tax=Piliocolobus tephrosceles TaxID=591936 RepID=A0A8C9I2L3_9PRIM